MIQLKFVKSVTAFILLSVLMTISVVAQKDTTSIRIGDKEIMITKSKTIMTGKIEKLAEGIVKFGKEIVKAEVDIAKAETKLDSLNDKKKSTSGDELVNIEKEIAKNESIIADNEKKIEALEKGIEDIESGIETLENDLDNIWKLEDFDELDKKSSRFFRKKFNGHYAGFEFGLVNFANNSNELASKEEVGNFELNTEKSFAYALNIWEYSVPIHNYFGIITGAGIEWNSFSLHRNIDLSVNEDDIIVATEVPTSEREYERNRFNMTYLTVPIIFEVQFPIGKERMYVGCGLTGSLRLWSKQKQTYYIDEEKHKDKNVDDFQLAPLRYGLTTRIGYGDFGIFANYSLVQLFEDGSGPELYPFSIGVGLNF